MTVIELDTGNKLEVKESKLFLNGKSVESIEMLVDILDFSENMDVNLKFGSEFMCFETSFGNVKYEYPIFIIFLLHEFKQLKLKNEVSCILTPKRKFKKEEILDILNNAFCAWLIIDSIYLIGKPIEYLTDSEIFVEDRLKKDTDKDTDKDKIIFKEFQIRLQESKIRMQEFKSKKEISEYLKLEILIIEEIEKILDFFLEFTGILDTIDELSDSEISKISIFSELLKIFEDVTKNFIGLMIHVISRLVFGKRLVSLQLFSTLMDLSVNFIYEVISLTAKNMFDIDNLFKPNNDQRRNLSELIDKINKSNGEIGEIKKLRNKSPLSHRFKPVNLSEYTNNKVIDLISPSYDFLVSLLQDNMNLIMQKIEKEVDEKLQDEIANSGISTDDILNYIYQLDDLLVTISKFTPSEVVKKVKYLRDLYFNLFLLSFFEETTVK